MTGILLIHGAWHGPWCWDGFAARLAERGHDVRTVQLRGHDQSGERIWHRIHHYLEDIRRAAERFAEPPTLVGHSMGELWNGTRNATRRAPLFSWPRFRPVARSVWRGDWHSATHGP